MNKNKFRVWDKERKEMITQDTEEFYINMNGDLVVDHGTPGHGGSHLIINNKDFIVNEFVGMDIHNKEIYRGDILRHKIGVFFVDYCEDCQTYALFDQLDNKHCYSCSSAFSIPDDVGFEDLKVMGNIYENKDLLNEND